jgi:hypothetical protein
MLTSKPRPKRRGRQAPKHDMWDCPLCFQVATRSLHLGKYGLYCVTPGCGFKESPSEDTSV